MKNRLLIGVIAATGAVALAASAAFAHTSIAESDPADQSTVEALPTDISIRFGNAMVPGPQPAQVSEASLLLLDPCGVRVDNDDSELDMTTSTVAATAEESAVSGRYEMQWTATAADGEGQAGIIDFVVSGGAPCSLVQRDDVADDIDFGFDPTSVKSKTTEKGADVTVSLNDKLVCKSFKSTSGQKLEVSLDTNWDDEIDYSGLFTCKTKVVRGKKVSVYKLAVTKAGEEAPSLKFRTKKTSPKALVVSIPASILGDSEDGHVDLYVSSTTESDDCTEDVSCVDRAPDLGSVRSF